MRPSVGRRPRAGRGGGWCRGGDLAIRNGDLTIRNVDLGIRNDDL